MADIIITLTNKTNSISCDLSVPVDEQISILKEDIAECLRNGMPMMYSACRTMDLYSPRLNQFLSNEGTLASEGILFGDYIVVGGSL